MRYGKNELDKAERTTKNATITVYVDAPGLSHYSRNGLSQVVLTVPIKDGKIGRIPKAKLVDEIEKKVRAGQRASLKEIGEQRAKIDKQAAALKVLVDKKGSINFFELGELVIKHWHETDVPGFEDIPTKKSVSRYRSDRQWSDKNKLEEIKRLDFKRNPENDDFFATEGRSRFWDARDEAHKDLKPGPLGSKTIDQLLPEDCFVKLASDGSRKWASDTTLHGFVREILGVAQKAGLIDNNPASLRIPKVKTTA